MAGHGTGGAGRDNQEIGDMTVDHQRLGAGEFKAVAGAHRLQRGV